MSAPAAARADIAQDDGPVPVPSGTKALLLAEVAGADARRAELCRCPDLTSNTRSSTRANTHAAVAKKWLLKSGISG
jgi:hypothetical protein